MKLLRQERGYTMLELLMVMAILGVVISGITVAFVSGSKAEVDLNRRFTGQQSSRLALAQLRKDIHTACDATTPAAGKLYLYPLAPAAALVNGVPACTGTPFVVWCTGTSSFNAVRYTLARPAATSCPATQVAPYWADYLTTNAIFTINTPLTGQRKSVTVDLPVNTNKASSATTSVDRYELKDTIVIRNGPVGP